MTTRPSIDPRIKLARLSEATLRAMESTLIACEEPMANLAVAYRHAANQDYETNDEHDECLLSVARDLEMRVIDSRSLRQRISSEIGRRYTGYDTVDEQLAEFLASQGIECERS